MSKISLQCNSCGGTLSIDEDREVLFCPYCGSKEIFEESDDVKKERIRSKAYKDVELGRFEMEQQIKADDNKHFTTLMKWLVILLIFMGIIVLIGSIIDP